jgi:hypothetical protein
MSKNNVKECVSPLPEKFTLSMCVLPLRQDKVFHSQKTTDKNTALHVLISRSSVEEWDYRRL